MTASTELGVEEFNEETGDNAAVTVPNSDPQEPDQQDAPEKTGGVQPHDTGIPHGHILTEDES
jgi:hypothetical protein